MSVVLAGASGLSEQAPSPAWFSPAHVERWTWAFVCLGATIRLTRYLLRFPLWEDEAFLAYNYLDRGFAELLTPLSFHQVAPIGYLWLQRATVELLGFSEWTLRLPAILVGLTSLVLFQRVSARMLNGIAQVLAVALFAVAYPLIRYSAEAKQYGFDTFFAVLLLWAWCEWRHERRRGWLLVLAVIAPIAVFCSHPVIFVAGAIGLVLLRECWLQPSWQGGSAWIAAHGLLAAAFLTHLWLSHRIHGGEAAATMHNCWNHAFPPLDEPWELPRWLILTHTGDLFAFPFGSGNGGSSLTALGLLAGVLLWWQEQRREALVLAVTPLALHLLAAALQRYPYGAHFKFTCYWIPLGTLLLATGLARLCIWLDRHRARVPIASVSACLVLGLLGLGVLVHDWSCPAKTRSDQRARDFARWFWFDAPHEGVLVCVHRDLHQYFAAEMRQTLNWYATYACNQRIYSSRPPGVSPDWERISEQRLLWCIEFRPTGLPFDDAAHQRWLGEIEKNYKLVSSDCFPMTRYNPRDTRLIHMDHVHVYKFRPLKSGSTCR
jgi:hypothetical protein